MKSIIDSIESYINDKELAWSPSTLRSERYRLLGLRQAITGDPDVLWKALKGSKPYSRVTAWTRVTEFWNYLMDKGEVSAGRNPFEVFRDKNARLFKNTYQERIPELTFEDARARISGIEDQSIRVQAERILLTGMRYFESLSYANGSVVGKGGKPRKVFLRAGSRDMAPRSYATFRRTLARVGLKPHDLRKLFAAKVVEEGGNEFELKELMGWANLNTASRYITAKKSRVKELVKRIQK